MKLRSNIKCLFSILLIGFILPLNSQIIRKSIGNYSSELEKKELKGKSIGTKIVFYQNSGLLVVEDNLALIGYDDIKGDTVSLNKDKRIPFKFQTTIQGNLNQIFKDNKYANLIRAEGTVTINNISKECVAYYAPIILASSSSDILMDFEIKFDLSDFNADDLILPLKGLIELDIEDGYVCKID
jgi:hypothetical protein